MVLALLACLAAEPAVMTSSTATTTRSATVSAAPAEAAPDLDALEASLAEQAPPPAEHTVEEIVITGSRTEKRLSDTPVATEVISRDELESSGAETLTEVLAKHPGVELQRTASGVGIRLQGLEIEHVLLLVDGERVTGRFRGGIDPSRFDPATIEQVEIVKGASSALYGSEAIGGVINLITRKTQRPLEADLRASLGSFTTLDITGGAGARFGDVSTRFSGGFHRSDGFDLNPGDATTTGTAYDGWDLENRTSWRILPNLSLRAGAGYRALNQQAVDVVRGSGAVFDRTQSLEVFNASLGPELELDGPAKFRASLHYSRFRFQILQDQRGDDQEDTYDDDRQQLAELTLQYDRLLWKEHLLTVGLEGLYETEEVNFLREGQADRQRGAVFAQDEWTALSGDAPLVIVPGVRLDLDSQFGSRVSPKLAVRFDPDKRWVLRGSFGLGFRAPAFEELYLDFQNPGSGYFITGNAELRPETAISANAGAEWHATGWLLLSANLFANWIDNLIDTQRIEGMPGELTQFKYVNVAQARTAGVETALELALDRRLVLDVGYTFIDGQDLTLGRRLPERTRHHGTLALRAREPDWGLSGTVRAAVTGRRPFFKDVTGDGLDDSAPPYVLMDVRVEKELFGHFALYAGANNLFDAGDHDLNPVPPRSFYAGIAVRYAAEEAR